MGIGDSHAEVSLEGEHKVPALSHSGDLWVQRQSGHVQTFIEACEQVGTKTCQNLWIIR